MTSRDPTAQRYDWNAFREIWVAIVPCAGVSLLAAVGGTLSILFQFRPQMHGSGATAAILYMVAVAVVPVVISCLLVGFVWARTALTVLLWIYLTLTVINLPHMFEIKYRAAWVMLFFILPELVALRLAHGQRLRAAVNLLAAKRNARWGPGFGWAIMVSACGLFATSAVTILLAEQLKAFGGADLTSLPGLLRLLPAVVGISIGALSIARAPVSRRPLRWLLVLNLLTLGLVVVLSGPLHGAGPFAITALGFDVLALAGSTRPEFTGFWSRQRRETGAQRGVK